jgi:hypothetical protein
MVRLRDLRPVDPQEPAGASRSGDTDDNAAADDIRWVVKPVTESNLAVVTLNGEADDIRRGAEPDEAVAQASEVVRKRPASGDDESP